MAFAPLFLARIGTRGEGAQPPDGLEQQLLRCWRAGSEQWPDIPLGADAFVCHLATHVPHRASGDALAHLLAQLVPADLFLACACAEGLPSALAAFERHHMVSLPSVLAHMRLSPAVVDEVRQRVRERLLVRGRGAPKIAEYSGRGTLANWVRVISLRTALSLLRTTHDEGPLSDALLELLPAPHSDPELEVIQRRYHDEFRRALEDAFAALPSEHRYLLRLHFVDHLSTTKIGALFSVNQSTVSRWLQSAQQAVHDETRRLLMERLDLSSQEFTSVLRTVESQINLSLSSILNESIHSK
ncbi:sigma-70 family RNA polymerase sigma factor [Myxococcus llanfairpwllgwyngyllgogerychwyrndrobwllllantysiliogogogochensis]|uniref:sigma-70 family RNA polymerase sigma factor n=1 Tax=Myxococcus llanfairpwllgwyngyllgogerychwyrndrobwllllantysiliogogogochensis TaxID=2590453 RepID=UPI0015F016D7|nr:sigma-70 family RNA polymerase sigma factor [Myxococcus llanfairpwllgwyngyllgogerychwyrndrobwllllantysiliogogogochensis]